VGALDLDPRALFLEEEGSWSGRSSRFSINDAMILLLLVVASE
jgi:hypothetical protein